MSISSLPPTHQKLLDDYKNNGKSAELVARHKPFLHKLAQLTRGIYTKQDATYKWFYSMFTNGHVKDLDKLEEVAEAVHLATHYVGFRGCYNQIIIFFLMIAKQFNRLKKLKRQKSPMTFDKYIRIAIGFHIHNWLYKWIKDVNVVGLMRFGMEEDYMPDIEPFTLNLNWIINGSKSPLFRGLKSFDRYLIYLYFVEGLSYRDIGVRTAQNKSTVVNHMRRIINRLRVNAMEL